MKALSSVEDQTAAPAYKERAPRVMTVLTAGKLILEDREALCRVRNLSTTGMMIETSAALQVGQNVRVGMRCGRELDARVAWARDGSAGLMLTTPIDVKAALAMQPPISRISRRQAARAPRLAVNCAIEVDAGAQRCHALLINISQSGAKLRLPFRPARDERLVLCVPGLPLKSGAVRWVREAEVGLSFYEMLPFNVLAEWSEANARSSGG